MPTSVAATDAARRLWAQAAGATSGPEEVSAAVERTCSHLRVELGRWIGVEGHRMLLYRALDLTRAEHPALDGLSCLGGDGTQTMAAVRVHGAAQVAGGMVALVTTLIELLGRIIGEDMAMHLVEQNIIPSPRGHVSTESKGGRDG